MSESCLKNDEKCLLPNLSLSRHISYLGLGAGASEAGEAGDPGTSFLVGGRA